MRPLTDLELLRIERGLTLREAAEQIGIGKSTLQRVERAPRLDVAGVHARTAFRIAGFYKLDLRKFNRDDGS